MNALKLAVGAAAAAFLWAGSANAALVQYGGNFSGIMFPEWTDHNNNPNDNDVQPVDPWSTQWKYCGYKCWYEVDVPNHKYDYSYLDRNGKKKYYLEPLPADKAGIKPLLGQLNYTLYYDDSVGSNSTATSMSDINWDGGTVVFSESTVATVFNPYYGPSGATAELKILGGTLSIHALDDGDGDICNFCGGVPYTEDLPYDFGADVPLVYEIDTRDPGEDLEYEILIRDGSGDPLYIVAGFIDLDDRSLDFSEPFNAIAFDPDGSVDEDVAFWMGDPGNENNAFCYYANEDGTRGEAAIGVNCGLFGETKQVWTGEYEQVCKFWWYGQCKKWKWVKVYEDSNKLKKDVSFHLAGWGDGDEDVPEPATLSLFGLGLIGLGAAVRRRRKAA